MLLAVTLPALLTRLQRDRRDPLMLMFVLAGAVYAWVWASQTWSLRRVLPLLVLAIGHLALALEVDRWRRSTTMTTAVVMACVIGAVGSAPGQARGGPAGAATGGAAGSVHRSPTQRAAAAPGSDRDG